jgi:hypothetical protein
VPAKPEGGAVSFETAVATADGEPMGQTADDIGRQDDDPRRVLVGARTVHGRVLLCGDEVDVPIERQFPLAAKAIGDLSRPGQPLSHVGEELGVVLDEQATHVVKLGRLDAHGAQHAPQGQ